MAAALPGAGGLRGGRPDDDGLLHVAPPLAPHHNRGQLSTTPASSRIMASHTQELASSEGEDDGEEEESMEEGQQEEVGCTLSPT